MAQNNTSEKPVGFCQKIHNAVSPFRARIFRISSQPPGSVSISNNEKPQSQTTPQTRPVRVLHQPSHSKMIPVEFEPHASHVVAERDVVIVESRKLSKSSLKNGKFSEQEFDDENKFSNYISKVKDRMKKTASNVSGGVSDVETSLIKDSFNDKVTNYINRAKIKVRKNTSVGDDKSFS